MRYWRGLARKVERARDDGLVEKGEESLPRLGEYPVYAMILSSNS